MSSNDCSKELNYENLYCIENGFLIVKRIKNIMEIVIIKFIGKSEEHFPDGNPTTRTRETFILGHKILPIVR